MDQQSDDVRLSPPTSSVRQQVVLTDVHIPFGSMVTLLVKFAIRRHPGRDHSCDLGSVRRRRTYWRSAAPLTDALV